MFFVIEEKGSHVSVGIVFKLDKAYGTECRLIPYDSWRYEKSYLYGAIRRDGTRAQVIYCQHRKLSLVIISTINARLGLTTRGKKKFFPFQGHMVMYIHPLWRQ